MEREPTKTTRRVVTQNRSFLGPSKSSTSGSRNRRSTIRTACLFLADDSPGPNFASMKTAVARGRRKKKKEEEEEEEDKSRVEKEEEEGDGGKERRLIHREEVLSICSRFSRAPTQFRCRCGQFNPDPGCSWNVLLSDYRNADSSSRCNGRKRISTVSSAVQRGGAVRFSSIYKMAFGLDCSATSSVVSRSTNEF